MTNPDPESMPYFRWVMLALALVFAYWLGRGYEREAHHREMFCDLPKTHLDAVLIYRDKAGELKCQRRGPAYLEM